MTTQNKTLPLSDWYCPHCRKYVPAQHVTFKEFHDPRYGGCDNKVIPNQPMEREKHYQPKDEPDHIFDPPTNLQRMSMLCANRINGHSNVASVGCVECERISKIILATFEAAVKNILSKIPMPYPSDPKHPFYIETMGQVEQLRKIAKGVTSVDIETNKIQSNQIYDAARKLESMIQVFTHTANFVPLNLDLKKCKAELSEARKDSERDGNWLDKWGCCKVCSDEIPDGHTNNCDIYKLELEIKSLKAALNNTK